MPISLSPNMTPIVVEMGAFKREPLTVLDVGARGGIKDHWRVFGDDLRFIGFEADGDELLRLQQQPDPRIKTLPFGLGGRSETRTLYVHYNPSGSSLYASDPEFTKRMLFWENSTTVREQKIELRRLDDCAAEVGDVDFIDIDTEGAELEIMQGGNAVFGRTRTLGISTEVRFLEGYNTPLFWETDQFLRRLGYSLYDLVLARESRRALPYPMFGDQRHETNSNVQIFGPTIGGQIAYGDAIYFRDLVRSKENLDLTKILKLACLFEIFDQKDSAAELILAHGTKIDKICDHHKLLDALVPVVGHSRPGYDEYISRFFSYDTIFRSGSLVGGRKQEIYAAARNLALELVRSPRGRRVMGAIAKVIFGDHR